MTPLVVTAEPAAVTAAHQVGRVLVIRLSDWPNTYPVASRGRFLCIRRYVDVETWNPDEPDSSYCIKTAVDSEEFRKTLLETCRKLVSNYKSHPAVVMADKAFCIDPWKEYEQFQA